jgi:hypothetical protein
MQFIATTIATFSWSEWGTVSGENRGESFSVLSRVRPETDNHFSFLCRENKVRSLGSGETGFGVQGSTTFAVEYLRKEGSNEVLFHLIFRT